MAVRNPQGSLMTPHDTTHGDRVREINY
ncbi:uncharacterized protein G2W53_038749 [Senna tora]|uniref:Uncharacterized protein n=1 Tax=Senna tora TaxID=362788 RepID=A0A834SLJ4_9FABA|nr:uncharacterized protein G2W53_038749 [Senna tora]